MSFIQKNDAVVINTKLTNKGRLLLASGSLTFKKIEFGDSEVDYNFLRDFNSTITGKDLSIMRPKDANPNIKYPIPITDGVLNVTKADITTINTNPSLIVNSAKQRGFFEGSTSAGFTALTSSTYIQNMFTIAISAVTGGTVLTVPSVTNITAGTMLLIDWRNPKLTTFTSLTGEINENYPRQFLWYKVQSVSGNDVTVDRTLPHFNTAPTTNQSIVYVYPPNNAIDNYYSTGTTVSYWNYNTLSFDSTCNIGANDDVAVWNLNIVYRDTPAGVPNSYFSQYYDGAIFSGFKEYIQGYTTNNKKSQIAIIHYTNNSISNYYGESFYNDTFKLTLPTIMYHGKANATMGIVLSSSTKQVLPTTLTGFTTTFYNLVETTSNKTVGKVFNDLRIAVIEDEELVNVLALKSDRSHTLPSPEWSLTPATTDILLPKYTTTPTQYLALTYLFTNENISNDGYNSQRSYGLRGGIHCGYIKYFDQDILTGQNVRFTFTDSDLKFMKSNITSSDGTGFNANKFYILAQKVTYGTELSPTGWKLIDYTPELLDYNWSDTTIPVSALTGRVYPLTNTHYTASTTTYDLTNFIGTLPTSNNWSSTPQLGFGEESIFLGNVNTDIQAIVYKTSFKQTLGFSNYNSSTNPTWVVDDDVYITEAGIYDQFDQLVAVGKLNNPVKKNTNKLFTMELDMDF